ncbi:hypothetical protein BD311DRAFT_771769 [Dichomitus squalens]|uniref:Uncharacterized protein n=1 Tax=Dichomitus squalens TaxID=114155 RepID=A0A4Q9M458_9APHY|nr:hypothetical protein BD311DRAFT_771769 [Dichomitus squalens]
MFSKLVPALVVLSALCGSYASPATEITYIPPGQTNGVLSATAVAVGTNSDGHITYSIGFELATAIAPTATAPDTTITAAATLVDGPSDAQFVEVLTVAGQTETVSEGCTLEKGKGVCTVVADFAQSTISTVVTVTSGLSVSRNGNGVGRIGVATISSLAVVVAGIVLGAAMV